MRALILVAVAAFTGCTASIQMNPGLSKAEILARFAQLKANDETLAQGLVALSKPKGKSFGEALAEMPKAAAAEKAAEETKEPAPK